MNQLKRNFSGFFREPRKFLRVYNLDYLVWVRSIEMEFLTVAFPIYRKFCGKGNTYLFNLDLHISVIREVRKAIPNRNIKLMSWSMSVHNHIIRKFFDFPDPVKIINSSNWKELDRIMITKLQKKYRRFFSAFDGFVVTYPTSFFEIFLPFGKPILAICPTRYEIPYTSRMKDWKDFDHNLTTAIKDGKLCLFVNSLAEQKYLQFYSGISAEIVPTICDYMEDSWRPNSRGRIFFSRSPEISKLILESTKGEWVPASEWLGRNYKNSKLMEVESIFILPYNNNTMHLFEMAYAGVPVVVPSKNFLRRLYVEFGGNQIMSEMSNFKVFGIDVSHLSENDPSNYKSDLYFEYWLNLCDFYDKDIMPNVFTIESFDELLSIDSRIDRINLAKVTKERNERLIKERNQKLNIFFEQL